MSKIKVLKVKDQDFVYFKEEGISGTILSTTGFTSATIGVVGSRMAQTHHYHNRPQNGFELIFVYQGKFELVADNKKTKYDVDQDGPIFIEVPSGTSASIQNIGFKEVKFYTVFAPPFKMGEIVYLKD